MNRLSNIAIGLNRLTLAGVVFCGVSASASLVGCSGSAEQIQAPMVLPADPQPQHDPVPGAMAEKIDRGIGHVERGDFASALPLFNEVVENDPKNAEAVYFQGLCLDQLGKSAEAIAAYEKAIELDPKLVNAKLNLAAIYIEAEGQAGKALELLKAVAVDRPKDPDVQESLGYAAWKQGDLDATKGYFLKALELKDTARLRLTVSEFFFEQKQMVPAVVHMRKAIEGFKDDLKIVTVLGHRFARAKAFEDCISAFTRAAELNPKEPAFLLTRGTCHHELKNEEAARADYTAALKIEPKYQPAYYYLGRSFLGEGKKVNALSNLEKAIAIDPKSRVGKAAKKVADRIRKRR